MIKRLQRITLCFFLMALLTGGPVRLQAEESDITALTILADPALALPLTKLASLYSAESHISVSATFLPSFEQSLAVEEGEAADLLLMAQPETIETMKQQGVLDINHITPLVAARLAMVTSGNLSQKTEQNDKALRALSRQHGFLLASAMAGASSEGYATEKWLQQLRRKHGLYFGSKNVQLQHSQEIMEFIRTQPGAYGIVFSPEADLYSDVTSIRYSDEEYPFTAAVVVGNQMKAARKLLDFLKGRQGRRIFMQAGFSPVIAD